jgi:signal peptidase I
MRVISFLFGFLALVVALAAFSLLCLRLETVSTHSMEPTLYQADNVVAASHYVMGPVSRGDVVEYYLPHDPSQLQFGRVAGVPGDRIQIHHGRLVLNGRPTDESYLGGSQRAPGYDFPAEQSDRSQFVPGEMQRLQNVMYAEWVRDGALTVPDGYFFILGDNRASSIDSRDFGPILQSNLFARPLYVYAGRAESSVRRPLKSFALAPLQ